MIGKISGRVDYVAEDHALIEAGGVGYLVFCAPTTLARLEPGTAAALYTDLVVREDLMQLFGFPTVAEREWHRLLTSVQGVGAKASLAILGALGAPALARALASGDEVAIRAAPGVGPKLAARIVRELKGRAPEVFLRRAAAGDAAMPAQGAGTPAPADPASAPPAQMAASPERPTDGRVAGAPAAPAAPAEATDPAAVADALSALVNLGYERGEAARAVVEAEAVAGAGADVSALIRAALSALAPGDTGR